MVAVIDIGVSMRADILAHKLRDGKVAEGRYCYWSLASEVPDGVSTGSRLWVANGGRWVGYFTVTYQPVMDSNAVCFYSEDFKRTDGGPRTPFRGFTYKVPTRGVE